ncbi:sensor domain-containing diguanylate cyclase [Anaerovorax sp. IOR16]|uniref:sensor domain-containing diguanylate cyclase n=1 Tax=Anaerovorax sp. IOR16 TaxID=2773458 RepID=UPI0019D103C6|nr:sensor domain-containing diguanylate cyclase [Anaerovorax sp. IOR16]
MKDDTNEILNRSYHFGYFAVSFLFLFFLSFIVLFLIEGQVREIQFESLKTNELRIVQLENDLLGKDFSAIVADIDYLYHAFDEKLLEEKEYDEIAKNWVEFSTHQGVYDQIRFIDFMGDEKIRINLKGEFGYIVPKNELQNKMDRYYFYEAIVLPKGSIYVSALDLNNENGIIEIPHKPMIRLSTPVYDKNSTIQGVIVLNYLAQNILESFRNLAENSRGEIVLINSKGDWLSCEDKTLEWNFMFEQRKEDNFSNKYPEEWKMIKNGNGQVVTDNGLFTFTTLYLEQKYNRHAESIKNKNTYLATGKWYIISSVLRSEEEGSLVVDDKKTLILDVFQKNELYFLLMGAISIIVAFLVYFNRKTYSKIKYYSEYDSLTKVYNRRAGIARINRLFPADEKKNFLVSLCFLDVNGLKQVNDTLGHKHGDELLLTVVNVIKNEICDYDFVIRMGGDEFLIVFHNVSAEFAETVWERILNGYEIINETENRPYLVSVSHGIVSYNNSKMSQVDDLIKVADEKMYQEKRRIKENLNVIRS